MLIIRYVPVLLRIRSRLDAVVCPFLFVDGLDWGQDFQLIEKGRLFGKKL